MPVIGELMNARCRLNGLRNVKFLSIEYREYSLLIIN